MKSSSILAIIAFVVLAWAFRWEITPVVTTNNWPNAYVLDRWTGAIYFLNTDRKMEVKPE